MMRMVCSRDKQEKGMIKNMAVYYTLEVFRAQNKPKTCSRGLISHLVWKQPPDPPRGAGEHGR